MEQAQKIRGICVKLLAQREHSQKQLLEKLSVRGFAEQHVQTVLTELAEEGWQSDLRFSESYARQRLAKGYGALKVRYELVQRGGIEIDFTPLVDELYGGWTAMLEALYQNRFDDVQQMTYKEWSRRSRFLQQRGFSAELIRELFVNLGIQLHA